MNAILGTVAECLHYYRCCHYDTYIQVKIDKSMTKKPWHCLCFIKGRLFVDVELFLATTAVHANA